MKKTSAWNDASWLRFLLAVVLIYGVLSIVVLMLGNRELRRQNLEMWRASQNCIPAGDVKPFDDLPKESP